MNPTSQTSRAEAVLTAVLARFGASVAGTGMPGAGTPLAGVSVGPDLAVVQSRKLPWLTVELADLSRRRTTADGQVENRAALDLTLHDAIAGGSQGMFLAYRWAAWLESLLILEAERTGGPILDGLIDGIEPDGIHLEVGGLGTHGFTVRVRFQIRFTTPLGAPFAT